MICNIEFTIYIYNAYKLCMINAIFVYIRSMYIFLYYIVLHNIILYYTILYYIVLHRTILQKHPLSNGMGLGHYHPFLSREF